MNTAIGLPRNGQTQVYALQPVRLLLEKSHSLESTFVTELAIVSVPAVKSS